MELEQSISVSEIKVKFDVSTTWRKPEGTTAETFDKHGDKDEDNSPKKIRYWT